MRVGLDTSVLVRLLTGEPEELARVALRHVRDIWQVGDRVLVSDWVAAETYHAVHHHYGVSKRAALEGLRSLLDSSDVDASAALREALAHPNLESAKPGFVDRLIQADYLAAGVDHVVTFETAARRLSRVRVLSV